jgi:hypothetical protein
MGALSTEDSFVPVLANTQGIISIAGKTSLFVFALHKHITSRTASPIAFPRCGIVFSIAVSFIWAALACITAVQDLVAVKRLKARNTSQSLRVTFA